MYKGKLLSTYIGHWTVWSLDIHTSNVGAVFIDDDDVPWDKEVAAKENEAIFDSLSPCRAYSWPNLSNDFMAQQRWLGTLQDFVI